MTFTIRDATLQDLPAILAITNHAIENTDTIWLERPVTLEARTSWFRERKDLGFPVLVACGSNEAVLGFGSFGPFRSYDGYARTVEHSIYVSVEERKRGVGQALLFALMECARRAGHHVMIGAVTAGNTASIALHTKAGFEKGGVLPEVGFKKARWLDLQFMFHIIRSDT